MHEFITSFLNKEELPEDQKPLVVFLICSSRETDYCNYRIMTILCTTYRKPPSFLRYPRQQQDNIKLSTSSCKASYFSPNLTKELGADAQFSEIYQHKISTFQ